MDQLKSEYEFLDLSDVNEEDRSSLICTLFPEEADNPNHLTTALQVSCSEQPYDLSSCYSSTEGPPTGTSSLDSLSPGERDMAPPHSPQRNTNTSHPTPSPHVPPPPYAAAPPPPYAPVPPHNQQWPVGQANVYVSQVTANVNVHGLHGFMGHQYHYQPAQSQYPPPPNERPLRGRRNDRRFKRPPSPQNHPPPYAGGYVAYPPYLPAAQAAQGPPLYHHHYPFYQPVAYPYPYHPSYVEYPVVEEPMEKAPEDYPPEIMMEEPSVDMFYPPQQYMLPVFDTAGRPLPLTDPSCPLEYPHVFVPPPSPHPGPPLLNPLPSQPHQFNVHAKNFVHKPPMYHENKLQETEQQKLLGPPPSALTQPGLVPSAPSQLAPPTTISAEAVETLSVKDLHVSVASETSPSPVDKKEEKPVEAVPPMQAKPPVIINNDKLLPKSQTEAQKSTWVTNSVKIVDKQTAISNTPSVLQTNNNLSNKGHVPVPAKTNKTPAPFVNNKQIVKSSPPQSVGVIIQQQNIPSKAPFSNKQRREVGPRMQESGISLETAEKTLPIESVKLQLPQAPLTKASAPALITLHTQPPHIVSKAPFGRKSSVQSAPESTVAPLPAPTASDFPPPPMPRGRVDVALPSSTAPLSSPPHPAPAKSWASLFSSKSGGPPTPQTAFPQMTEDTPATFSAFAPPSLGLCTPKPVAKVGPFDASPIQQNSNEKTHSVGSNSGSGPLSYSEKTSSSGGTSAPATKLATQTRADNKEDVSAKDVVTVPTPAVSSAIANDPNSYRMGDFLYKYQLDNRTVSLVPRGLSNRSNFCYINAVLQALIACPPFYNMLKALPYQTRRGKSSTPIIDAMVELCYEFTPLLSARAARGRVVIAAGEGGAADKMPLQTGPPLDPSAGQAVLRAMRGFAGSQEGRQEDAEEFLGCLLNGLNDEMLELIKLVEPEEAKEVMSVTTAVPNGILVSDPLQEDDEDDWKVMGPKNKGSHERRCAAGRTPLSDIFQGRTRSRLHRAASEVHHDVTDCVQPFFTLQLDIERASSVKEALELVAGREAVEGVRAGGRGVEAWQQVSLEQLPVVLVLHLKCFQLDADGHTAKLLKNIHFPIDLKIDPKIMSLKSKAAAAKQRLYKLLAVVYHEGAEAVKGHYVTDVYHTGCGGWIRYDDSSVTQVAESVVLKPKPPRMPYLLLYRRQDSVQPTTTATQRQSTTTTTSSTTTTTQPINKAD